MVKKLLLQTILLITATLATAADVTARNLILNGDFEFQNKNFPPFWMYRAHSGSTVEPFANGGPDNKPFVRVRARRSVIMLRQNNLTLVKGGKYRLSAFLRTCNVKKPTTGIIVEPGRGEGLVNLPENQKEWKFFSCDFTMDHSSKKDNWIVSIRVDSDQAELDVSQLKLIALSEDARKGSKTQIEKMQQDLVPLFLLQHTDIKKTVCEFFWIGQLPGAPENMQWVFKLNNSTAQTVVPFSTRKLTMDLTKLAPRTGNCTLRAELQEKSTGRKLFTRLYQMRLLDTGDLSNPGARKLNNLVSAVYSGTLPAGGTVSLGNDRNGWLYFKAETTGKVALQINGTDFMGGIYPAHEVVRKLDMGRYTIKNNGTAEVKLTVRQIPDIHMFPLGSCRVHGNDAYDWQFAKKYMLPAFTTINVSGMTPAERAESKLYGLEHLNNFGVLNPAKPNDADDLIRRLDNFKAMSSDMYDGTTMDEVEYWDPPAIDPYVRALREYKNPHNKIINSWVIGPPSFSYSNYISAGCNVSGGYGRVLYEVYNRMQYTEKEAFDYISQTNYHVAQYRDIAPQLMNSLSVILGNFTLAPMSCLDHNPDADGRYFLDMQMHMLANDPRCQGLGGVGFWGTHSADEEMVRWCFALLKHYAIEGNKEMLSKRYGYTFHPGILKNGDFDSGLDHWQSRGEVKVMNLKNFGKKYQGRYGTEYQFGDNFAVLTRLPDQSAELRQKLTGLIPGKTYSIFYMTADYDDVVNLVDDQRKIPLTLTVEGATIIRRSYYVENRKFNGKTPRMNTAKYVFVPQSSEVEVVFSNHKAQPGERALVNFISVRKYFDR